MGIIRTGFCFMLGTVYGAYLAQNYNIPDIKKLATSGIFMAKHIEETYRKPGSNDDRKPGSNDDSSDKA